MIVKKKEESSELVLQSLKSQVLRICHMNVTLSSVHLCLYLCTCFRLSPTMSFH